MRTYPPLTSWHVQKSDHPGGLLIKPIPGPVVAQCDELPEMEANAYLLAAAPDLLEACKAAVAALSQPASFPSDIKAAKSWLNAAIAKAEGR